jgi:hypothetical protein
MARTWPTVTLSPFLTLIEMTRPGMGERTVDEKSCTTGLGMSTASSA